MTTVLDEWAVLDRLDFDPSKPCEWEHDTDGPCTLTAEWEIRCRFCGGEAHWCTTHLVVQLALFMDTEVVQCAACRIFVPSSRWASLFDVTRIGGAR